VNDNQLKFISAAILFIAWVTIVVMNVPNSQDLISFIKFTLVGLCAHTSANLKAPQ
jgi:hypothetical protein